ncbi:MAG: ankyrin repeat domain-containing protein [Candidatus Thiodiazotropha endolucinida]|nr:ankyrin repeat domain-containing protein [Candidatus Thiodiazotropha taylori]MCG8103434.1 ankyrin repeat domain-containing protein [Candidatus Thiodiazotropha taylori]MCW4288760.1 ankyrin repeat domain-containing protein [Candidatus Thiodiazotropha endolucinida]
MYQEYFKLRRRPFNITPDPAFYYLTLPVRQYRDRIYAAIRQQAPVILLSGAPGTGKTAFLKHLLVHEAASIQWVFVDKPQLRADDLLMLIGEAFGVPLKSTLSDEYSLQIRNRMTALEGQGVHPVIILDEADHLADDTLEELLDWHASNRIQGVSCTLILAGLPQLVQKIDDMGHVLFTPPWGEHFTLEPFDHQDMCAVIAHCLKIAGHEAPGLFDSQALKSIFALSEGVPRVINHICDLCLFCAANLSKRQVTREVVEEVSRFILLDEDTSIQFGTDTEPLSQSTDSDMPVIPRHSMKHHPVIQWLRDGLLAVIILVCVWVIWLEESPVESNRLPSQVALSGSQDVDGEDDMTSLSSESIQEAGFTDIVQAESPEETESINDQVDDTSHMTADIEQIGKQTLAADHPGPMLSGSNKQSGVSGKASPNKADRHPLTNQGETVRQGRAEKVVTEPQLDLALEKPVMSETDSRIESQLPSTLTRVSLPEDEQLHTDPAHLKPLQSEQAEAASSAIDLQINETPAETALNSQLKDKVHLVAPQIQTPVAAIEKTSTIAAFEETTTKMSETKPIHGIGSQAVNPPTSDELIAAINNGDRQEVLQLLLTGAPVDSVSSSGETALMKAAWAGRLDLVDLLISKAPQINQQSQEGWTALFYAAVRGHFQIVSALLKNGAEVNLADLDGNTPLMAAAWNGHTQVAELLLNQGVDPNWHNHDGWSPLMFAALEGHIDIARLLIRHGADISLISHDGETSTDLAAQQGHTQLVSLLARE